MRKAKRPVLPSAAAGHQESSARWERPRPKPCHDVWLFSLEGRGKLLGDSQPNGAHSISRRQPPHLPTGLARGLCSVFFALTKQEISPLSCLPFGDLHPGPGSVRRGLCPTPGAGPLLPPTQLQLGLSFKCLQREKKDKKKTQTKKRTKKKEKKEKTDKKEKKSSHN